MGDCCGTYNHLLWLYPVRRSYRLFRSYEVNTSLLLWNLWEMFLQDYMSAICNRGLKDDTHHDTPALYYNMIHNSKIKEVLSNYLHIWPQLNLYWLSTYQFLMNAYIVLFFFFRCQCNGHSATCDSDTGKHCECQNNTRNPSCAVTPEPCYMRQVRHHIVYTLARRTQWREKLQNCIYTGLCEHTGKELPLKHNASMRIHIGPSKKNAYNNI